LALCIPNFTDFLNIAGSLGAGMIGFVLPPWLYNAEFKSTISRKKYWFNWFILVFGILGSGLSIYTSIRDIINRK
jgi:amino acid permease